MKANKPRWVRMSAQQIKENGLISKVARARNEQGEDRHAWPYFCGDEIKWKGV